MISLEISDGNLRYFEFSRSRGRLVPKDFGTLYVPQKGSEAKPVLEKFARGKKSTPARVVIPESEAKVFSVMVYESDKRLLRSAIEKSFAGHTTLPLEDAIFDYDVVRLDKVRGGAFVAVSVLPKKSVSAHNTLLKSVGFKPMSFTTESHALARSLFSAEDTGAHAVVSIGQRHSVAFIVDNGSVCASVSIPLGSADIEAAIAKALDVPIEKARSLKDTAKGFEVATPVFSAIKDDLAKMLAHWKHQGTSKVHYSNIKNVVLAGSDSLVPGFSKLISLSTKLPTKVGSVWTRTPFDAEVPDLNRRESLDYGAAIGALL